MSVAIPLRLAVIADGFRQNSINEWGAVPSEYTRRRWYRNEPAILSAIIVVIHRARLRSALPTLTR